MNAQLAPERSTAPTERPSVIGLWRSVLPSAREIASARRRLHLKSIAIAVVLGASYWMLVLSGWAVPIRLAGALGVVVSAVAVGTGIMHDANHGSFSRRRWLNRALACTSDALGASSWLWRYQHNNLHHGNTNVVGFDADIALAPFARLAPTQPWKRWYRAQHIYIWPLYGFLSLKNLLVSDVVALATGRIDQRPLRRPVTPLVVARVVAGKLVHVAWAIVIPLAFNPWWGVLAFYLACSWLVGFVLAMTFQLAHCVDGAEFPDPASPRRQDDFATHQLRTTCNIASPMPVAGACFRWLVGGLDHQIEHHLAPRLPHPAYPALARRFRALCQLHGIDYHVHPGVWSAVCAHGRWLRKMARPPVPLAAPHATG
ncbi:MAG TPA: acyl-CoA desaturase [Ilumatobacter sp.]|nr:acyl-CoA desaturase [Ilumatobacter sp.]